LLDIDVEIFNKRAEILKNDEYEKFDIVTSRAVAPLAQILEISIPYAKITGIIIEPKSKNYLNEMFGIN
jgi:16S rRNA (guanine527-N7)-methyltransferase